MINGKLEVPVILLITPADLNGINLLAHKLKVTFPELINEWVSLDIDRHVVTRPAGTPTPKHPDYSAIIFPETAEPDEKY